MSDRCLKIRQFVECGFSFSFVEWLMLNDEERNAAMAAASTRRVLDASTVAFLGGDEVTQARVANGLAALDGGHLKKHVQEEQNAAALEAFGVK